MNEIRIPTENIHGGLVSRCVMLEDTGEGVQVQEDGSESAAAEGHEEPAVGKAPQPLMIVFKHILI